MGKYTNGTRNKKCPECGNWFIGDETVKGELCPDCADDSDARTGYDE